MTFDFRNVLGTKVEDIKRPPLIPVGTYRARVNKPVSFDETQSGSYKMMDFSMQLVEPQLDVSAEDLENYGGLGPTAVLRNRFMFNTEDSTEAKASNDRAVFRMKQFLSDHLKVSGEDLNELAANALNHECLVVVKWRADKNDPEIQYNEISKTLALPE